MIQLYWMWPSIFWFIELILLPNASNSVHAYFCVWIVILNSLSARKIHVHNGSIVKLYVYTKGKQIYRRVRCSTQSSTLRVHTHQHSRVGSGRVGSSPIWLKESEEVHIAQSSPIWLTESGEVHTARFKSNPAPANTKGFLYSLNSFQIKKSTAKENFN